jgi:hypothetical protein
VEVRRRDEAQVRNNGCIYARFMKFLYISWNSSSFQHLIASERPGLHVRADCHEIAALRSPALSVLSNTSDFISTILCMDQLCKASDITR